VIHGETGYLYESGNINELYRNLNELYLNGDKCIQFGINGRRRVVEYFSQDMYLNNLFACFKEY
jgi:hypothetical protein